MTKNWQETVMSADNVATLGYGEYDEKRNFMLRGTALRTILEKQAQATWEARQQEVDEAKKLVATDIGETLCVLAGNLMMEDKEAGSLLATQLQPIMDWLKTKYIPDLPRLATVETIINQQADEAEQRGVGKITECSIFQRFLWYADNVPCMSELVGSDVIGCECATCLAKKMQAFLKEYGLLSNETEKE